MHSNSLCGNLRSLKYKSFLVKCTVRTGLQESGFRESVLDLRSNRCSKNALLFFLPPSQLEHWGAEKHWQDKGGRGS